MKRCAFIDEKMRIFFKSTRQRIEKSPGPASKISNLQELIQIDTAFASFLLLEQSDSAVTQNSKILSAMFLANAATVFIKSIIKAPMKLVPNTPM